MATDWIIIYVAKKKGKWVYDVCLRLVLLITMTEHAITWKIIVRRIGENTSTHSISITNFLSMMCFIHRHYFSCSKQIYLPDQKYVYKIFHTIRNPSYQNWKLEQINVLLRNLICRNCSRFVLLLFFLK